MVVTKKEGKNVVTFPQGEPNPKIRKLAQEFADDLLHLKEGEQTRVNMDDQRK